MENNELDDSNNEVDGNDLEDASEGGATTIQDGEPSIKKKRTIIPKLCGNGSHYLYQHAKKKKVSQRSSYKQKKNTVRCIWSAGSFWSADLTHSAHEKMKAMGQVLSRAREQL